MTHHSDPPEVTFHHAPGGDETVKRIIKTTIFLADMELFAAVNEVYGTYFSEAYPARETVAEKGLPKGVNVEISVTAFKK